MGKKYRIKKSNTKDKSFMKRLFPPLFEKAILEATEREERLQLTEQFVMSPLTDFDCLQDLIGYIKYLGEEENKIEESEVLFEYAKIAIKIFLDKRTEVLKNGISLQYCFKDKVIQTIGQSLNEGVTELISRKVIKNIHKDDEDFLQKHPPDGAYLLEVKAAEKLIELIGEDVVMMAYFQDVEQWNELMDNFDARFGKGAFLTLLNLCDTHQWPDVFKLLQ